MKTSLRSLVVVVAMALAASAAGCAFAKGKAEKPRRIEIAVTQKGFEPDRIAVKKGEAVSLVFTRKTDKTCAKDIFVMTGDGKKIEKSLPLDQPVIVDATFAKSGELRYACSMDMITGVITVE